MSDNDPDVTQSFLGDQNDSSADVAPASRDVESPNQPEHIGRYRIQKVLGRGSFGLVYLAYDEQLDRPVAVKVPHARLVSRPEQAEAYLTEACTVANLDQGLAMVSKCTSHSVRGIYVTDGGQGDRRYDGKHHELHTTHHIDSGLFSAPGTGAQAPIVRPSGVMVIVSLSCINLACARIWPTRIRISGSGESMCCASTACTNGPAAASCF